MRIEFFSDSYLPGLGGTEVVVSSLAQSFCKSEEVCVACPKYKDEPKNLGFKVFRSKSILIKKPANYCAFSSFDKKFKQDIEEFKPDVISVHSVNDMLSRAIKLGKKLNVPVVATIHTKFKDCWLQDTKSRLITACMLAGMKRKLRQVDLITTVSNNMKNILESYKLNVPIVVVKNGCQKQRCENIDVLRKDFNKHYHFDENVFTFLFVGRLDKVKNIDFSLKMLQMLKEKNIDFRFIIVGDGNYKNYYIKQTQKLGLSSHVWFLNAIDGNNIDEVYARSDLFLFPSLFDTDGLVVCEAACFKTPSVVIEKTGAAERIKNNETGFVVKNDLLDYFQTVQKIINDKKLLETVSQNAYNNLPQSWDEVAKKYKKVFEEQIKKGKLKK